MSAPTASDVAQRWMTNPEQDLMPWPELDEELALLATIIDYQRREAGKNLEREIVSAFQAGKAAGRREARQP